MEKIFEFVLKTVENNSKRTDVFSGIPSGFISLDKVTLGWQKSNLIVIASRPSMGKTSFTLSMVRNMIVDFKTPVLYFTLEMNETQLITKLLCIQTELPHEKISIGKLEDWEWTQLDSKCKELQDSPLFVQAKFRELQDIRKECCDFVEKHKDGIIFIDNLQQIINSSKTYVTRDHEDGDIVRELKALAKELDVPIIITSSLNRDAERRGGDMRPKLSDMKDTGEIENVADVVCLIHRPEYYGIMYDEEGNSTMGLGQVILAKNRNGSICDVNLRFRQEFARFEEWDSIIGLLEIPSLIINE
ncbi:MAG: DnaB-like helicase C-terminal domain-containing protein [Bacteroidales bacterium]|nr:DnaB-like helicase C-terminal domain-containing protein [bacterium]MBQ3655928.1 DnaB-like helicase C-terminal domain-containing protein [Bacteroidales bacterium]